MALKLLTETEIDASLTRLPEWRRVDVAISRKFSAASFPAGIELVRRVAVAAEAADHHPDIDIRWRTVKFMLSTHSMGGLTKRDMELAQQIDQLIAESE